MILERVGEFLIGGELPIRRLGFGAMRNTGPGVWGPPSDLHAAQSVLQGVVDLGINFIDTADVYGPGDNERLIRDTLAAPIRNASLSRRRAVSCGIGLRTAQNTGMGT